jgi:uncharacterized protein
MAVHHFTQCGGQMEAFERLRSVQFDPIAPVGCNHDLVLQARVPGYKIGDWAQTAYTDRKIYDGWDKQASLIPFEGWPLRRIMHTLHRRGFEKKIFEDHKDAVEAILKEITDRGPLMPKDFDFQLRKQEWKGSWFGPSVTKQTLRALWHSGLVMTAGRKNGQHLYDLAERVVPSEFLNVPRLPDHEARLELALERHRAMGIVRPNASAEIWSYQVMFYEKKQLISELVDLGKIVPVEVEGVKANASPEFLALLDQPPIEPRVTFIAPLDQFLWDRKMTAHVYGFDYSWEIYTPEAKRRWGYYVLPILYGEDLVARVEFWCREGVLEMRQWHFEAGREDLAFLSDLEHSLGKFMAYCSAKSMVVAPHIDARIRDLARSVRPS